jgi:hypothetical protein
MTAPRGGRGVSVVRATMCPRHGRQGGSRGGRRGEGRGAAGAGGPSGREGRRRGAGRKRARGRRAHLTGGAAASNSANPPQARSSVVEHYLDTVGVVGSIPIAPTAEAGEFARDASSPFAFLASAAKSPSGARSRWPVTAVIRGACVRAEGDHSNRTLRTSHTATRWAGEICRRSASISIRDHHEFETSTALAVTLSPRSALLVRNANAVRCPSDPRCSRHQPPTSTRTILRPCSDAACRSTGDGLLAMRVIP